MKKRKASGTRRRRGLEEMKKRRETEERRRILAEKEARKLAEERRARKAAEEAERQRAEAARQAEAEARARAETEEARLFAEERRIEKARAEEARREAVRKREAKRTDRESRQAEREAKRAAREAKKAERTAKQANRETKRTDRKAAKADRKDGGKRKDSKAKAAASRSSKIQYAILGFVFAVGFCLMAYPTFSDYWNSFTQSRAIMSYAESISGLSDEEYDALYQFAEDYNANIVNRQNIFMPSEEEKVVYNEALNLGGNGIMGYINIPVIDQTIPIYHGTTESVLQVAVGHLEWTSLPVGGPGTHCVLSGHRGLPSARLFTDLDKVVVGDTFTLNILDEILTYEVDQILIARPTASIHTGFCAVESGLRTRNRPAMSV